MTIKPYFYAFMSTVLTCESDHQSVTLSKKIASSGEGEVWETNQRNILAKIYYNPTSERIDKLRAMLVNPPVDPMKSQNHISIAFPLDLLKNQNGAYVGFLMPAIRQSRELTTIYNPSLRRKKAPGFNWYYLHVTALNTAWIIQSIHDQGYVLGDIKSQNILVNDRALVAVIDTDSFQVRHTQTGKIYRCTVGSEGFTPVELLGKDFSVVDQTEIHDRFRIAILIHYLLFGYHPFSGQWVGIGDSPEQNELIRQGFWYGGHNSLIRPSQNTISLDVVHPEVKHCFLRCFNDGHRSPDLRPTAEDWHKALEVAISSLTICGKVDNHYYSHNYGKCYWCERASMLGIDVFPVISSRNLSTNQGFKHNLSQISQIKVAASLNRPQPQPKIPLSVSTQSSRVLNKQLSNVNALIWQRRKFLQILGLSSLAVPLSVFAYVLLNSKVVVSSPSNKKAYFQTIGEAIKNAEPNSKIFVPPGSYQEGLIIDKSLEIIGDGSREEIVIESTNSDCIVMQTNSATVRNLTLRCKAGEKSGKYYGVDIPQGRLVIDSCEITSDSLACVAIHNSNANPTIRNCRIYGGNTGGIFAYESCSGTIDNCDIYGNALAGVEIIEGSNLVIRNSRIYNGKESGVFIRENGKGTIEDCDIYSNAHSGTEISEGGDPVIRNCRIYNGKKSGIFIYQNGKGTIEDCDICDNAHSGITITRGSSPLIYQCKINRNRLTGVRVHNDGRGTIQKCDLTNNGSGAFYIDSSSNVQLYSNKE